MTRYYVGKKHNSIARVVFTSAITPTQQTHGERFSSVIGPFKAKRAAQFTALFGHNNPHIQTVSDAERIAKTSRFQRK
jgi:hypothetical protein